MRAHHPQFRCEFRKGLITWTGKLQPSALSDTYLVRIRYRRPERPKVWVIRPRLTSCKANVKIPHTFFDGTLCLHLPGQWIATMLIADTIVPWISLWLLHYEIWHALGEWHGGGHEPKDSDE